MTHYIQGQRKKLSEPDCMEGTALRDIEIIDTKIVPKVWGSEEIIHNQEHCVKRMTLEPDCQVSMHWHANKQETFILISGVLIIETITQSGDLRITELTSQGESFTLCRNVPHTFYCPKGQNVPTVFLEASTQDSKDDSYRIFPSRER